MNSTQRATLFALPCSILHMNRDGENGMLLVSYRVYFAFSVFHICVNLQESVEMSTAVEKTPESLHSREPRMQDTEVRISKVEQAVKIRVATRVRLVAQYNSMFVLTLTGVAVQM